MAIINAVKSGSLDIQVDSLISDRNSAALKLAEEAGIQSHLVDYASYENRTSWGSALTQTIASYDPDLVVSVGFMRILPPEVVNKFQIINTHPALLPLFPGAHAVRDALASGADETGTTVHWVDEGVDTGEIISQRKVSIEENDSEDSLHERIKIQERELIVETLHRFASGTLERAS
jgi:phosphoribosylglycinamide formyltransferase-1